MKKAVIYKESDSNYKDIREFKTIEDLFSISQNYDLIIATAKGCDVAVTICDGNINMC